MCRRGGVQEKIEKKKARKLNGKTYEKLIVLIVGGGPARSTGSLTPSEESSKREEGGGYLTR